MGEGKAVAEFGLDGNEVSPEDVTHEAGGPTGAVYHGGRHAPGNSIGSAVNSTWNPGSHFGPCEAHGLGVKGRMSSYLGFFFGLAVKRAPGA